LVKGELKGKRRQIAKERAGGKGVHWEKTGCPRQFGEWVQKRERSWQVNAI